MIHAELHPLVPEVESPGLFPSPFSIPPHALASQACELLKQRLSQMTPAVHNYQRPDGGKMLGTLVVRLSDGHYAYLAGFSGMLGGQWSVPGFVPPVFNPVQRDKFLPAGEARVEDLGSSLQCITASDHYGRAKAEYESTLEQQATALNALKAVHSNRRRQRAVIRQQIQQGEAGNSGDAETLESLAGQSSRDKREYRELSLQWKARLQTSRQPLDAIEDEINHLKKQRLELSRQHQQCVFDGYKLKNAEGECASLAGFFEAKMPPGGAGDCVAIKLLQHCYRLQLEPLCMAEFWWGATPSAEIRHHGYYYPACRGKCGPILPFMLRGLDVSAARHQRVVRFPDQYPLIIYEDSSLLVVEKPAGMLSVPGKNITDSVEKRLQNRYPDINSTMLVHRLDQATSGLLVAAKSSVIRTRLQQQFQRRTVEKIYIADVAGRIDQSQGTIDLPMRVDLDDRPRQRVCLQHGKSSLSHFRVVATSEAISRIELSPVTGRTHQLRVHAAHPEGLNAAIIGDELYGEPAERLHLHAASIAFMHPLTGKRMQFHSPVPF
ncbi:hypothetical protein AB833_28790 [Chromatiales bacterium (ex Bugula neritina AB1)]|nr:hypothetical protein AB833_28790 [Chromatiales bacterium (ex Bugula neritina AB1)]